MVSSELQISFSHLFVLPSYFEIPNDKVVTPYVCLVYFMFKKHLTDATSKKMFTIKKREIAQSTTVRNTTSNCLEKSTNINFLTSQFQFAMRTMFI